MGRSTTVRDRHRRAIARTKPPCGIYLLHGPGEDAAIDYTLRYPDPWCYVVDHIIPLNKGGIDELGNKQAAHNTCNRAKSDRHDEDVPEDRVFVTARTW